METQYTHGQYLSHSAHLPATSALAPPPPSPFTPTADLDLLRHLRDTIRRGEHPLFRVPAQLHPLPVRTDALLEAAEGGPDEQQQAQQTVDEQRQRSGQIAAAEAAQAALPPAHPASVITLSSSSSTPSSAPQRTLRPAPDVLILDDDSLNDSSDSSSNGDIEIMEVDSTTATATSSSSSPAGLLVTRVGQGEQVPSSLVASNAQNDPSTAAVELEEGEELPSPPFPPPATSVTLDPRRSSRHSAATNGFAESSSTPLDAQPSTFSSSSLSDPQHASQRYADDLASRLARERAAATAATSGVSPAPEGRKETRGERKDREAREVQARRRAERERLGLEPSASMTPSVNGAEKRGSESLSGRATSEVEEKKPKLEEGQEEERSVDGSPRRNGHHQHHHEHRHHHQDEHGRGHRGGRGGRGHGGRGRGRGGRRSLSPGPSRSDYHDASHSRDDRSHGRRHSRDFDFDPFRTGPLPPARNGADHDDRFAALPPPPPRARSRSPPPTRHHPHSRPFTSDTFAPVPPPSSRLPPPVVGDSRLPPPPPSTDSRLPPHSNATPFLPPPPPGFRPPPSFSGLPLPPPGLPAIPPPDSRLPLPPPSALPPPGSRLPLPAPIALPPSAASGSRLPPPPSSSSSRASDVPPPGSRLPPPSGNSRLPPPVGGSRLPPQAAPGNGYQRERSRSPFNGKSMGPPNGRYGRDDRGPPMQRGPVRSPFFIFLFSFPY
jgi:hypothetical protein